MEKIKIFSIFASIQVVIEVKIDIFLFKTQMLTEPQHGDIFAQDHTHHRIQFLSATDFNELLHEALPQPLPLPGISNDDGELRFIAPVEPVQPRDRHNHARVSPALLGHDDDLAIII